MAGSTGWRTGPSNADGWSPITGDAQGFRELTPEGFNVRTRVHEYGGAPYTVIGQTLYFANFADQRLYAQTGDERADRADARGLSLCRPRRATGRRADRRARGPHRPRGREERHRRPLGRGRRRRARAVRRQRLRGLSEAEPRRPAVGVDGLGPSQHALGRHHPLRRRSRRGPALEHPGDRRRRRRVGHGAGLGARRDAPFHLRPVGILEPLRSARRQGRAGAGQGSRVRRPALGPWPVQLPLPGRRPHRRKLRRRPKATTCWSSTAAEAREVPTALFRARKPATPRRSHRRGARPARRSSLACWSRSTSTAAR